MREAQFSELATAVDGVARHIAELPQRLLASLQAAEGLPPAPTATASTDLDDGLAEHVPAPQDGTTHDAAVAAETTEPAQPSADAAAAPEAADKRPRFGVNPLSSFAQVDKQIAAETKEGGTVGKVKGPRLPAIRLWGATGCSLHRR